MSPLVMSDASGSFLSAPDGNECGAVGEMRSDRGNRSTRRKLSSVPLCPLTLLDLRLNPGRRGGKLATARLNHIRPLKEMRTPA
jgi:hypothetical protein